MVKERTAHLRSEVRSDGGKTSFRAPRERLFGHIQSERERLLVSLLAALTIGLIAHAYGFLHLTISFDSLAEFQYSSTFATKIRAGRFFELVLRRLMGEIITLPWLSGLFSLCMVGLSVYYMTKMFRLDRKWEIILLSGIFATNLSFTVLAATYIHDLAADMLALFISVYAAYAWTKMADRFLWKQTLIGATMIFLAAGLYQALFAVTVSLICMYAIQKVLRGDTVRLTVRMVCRSIPLLILGLIVYELVMQVTLHFYDLEARMLSDLTYSLSDPWGIIRHIPIACLVLLRTLVNPCDGSFYSMTPAFSYALCIFNVVLVIICACMLIGMLKKKKAGLIFALLCVFLVFPICLTCVIAVGKSDHVVIRYPFYLFYLLIFMIFRRGTDKLSLRKSNFLKTLLIVMLSVMLLNNVQVSNVAYEVKEMRRQSTQSTMTRVLYLLEDYEDYRYGESQVALVGLPSVTEPLEIGDLNNIPALKQMTQMGASQNGYYGAYFKNVLQYPIKLCTNEEVAQLKESPEVAEMPCFPSHDCIKTVDGVIVIKLSD